MLVTVLTPEKEVFKGEIKSVKVPGTGGQFEILDNHAPIVSSLKDGEVRMITEVGDTRRFRVNRGFVEVINNEVSLLVTGYQEQ